MSALSERIQLVLDENAENGVDQVVLAKAAGVTKSTVNQWITGDIKSIKLEYALGIQEAFGYNAIWLVLGKGNKRDTKKIELESIEDHTIAVRRVIFKISAGIAGFSVDFLDNGDAGAPVYVTKHWLESRGYLPEKLYAIEVSGHSMVPSLFEGDIVIVNTGDTGMVDGEVYAVNFEGETTVKRLERDMRQWYLASDNPDRTRYPRKMCEESTYILGRIVHKISDHI